MKKRTIKAVILDWAGTTVDFGSIAPVEAFREAFAEEGLPLGDGRIRRYMGLPKKDHVRCMLYHKNIAEAFEEKRGKKPCEADVDRIYGNFEPALIAVIKDYAKPLPDVPETVERLRKSGILIGSTTGYTKAMMEILCPVSESLGYAPDCLVCPDDVGGIGRPYPYMLWENLRRLNIESIDEVLKIGDTEADIREGKNAGCISIGIVKGSNMLGLSEEKYEKADPEDLEVMSKNTREKYKEAGADFTLESITDIPAFIESL